MIASAPSKTAIDTSDTSARVGTGAEIMDSSICVATTNGLARPARGAGLICLLDAGNRLKGHLDAQIAPGDHQGHRKVSIISVQPLDSLRLLDLGENCGTAPRAILRTSATSSGLCTKGERDPVDVRVEGGVRDPCGPCRSGRRPADRCRAG